MGFADSILSMLKTNTANGIEGTEEDITTR